MRVVERLVQLRHAIVLRRVREPRKKIMSPSRGDVDSLIVRPAHKRPNNITTSCRLTIISPTGKWNVCISGRHQSKIATSREESY
jgi:hypothetical protein